MSAPSHASLVAAAHASLAKLLLSNLLSLDDARRAFPTQPSHPKGSIHAGLLLNCFFYVFLCFDVFRSFLLFSCDQRNKLL
jgi:hypothetical protein